MYTIVFPGIKKCQKKLIMILSMAVIVHSAQTDSIFQLAVVPFCKVNSVQGTLYRVQTFKSVVRESAGSLAYDINMGMFYSYSAPSKFDVICSGDSIVSVDVRKNLGFKLDNDRYDILKNRDLDPLKKIFSICLFDKKVVFLGSVDNLSIFGFKKSPNHKLPSITFGVERETNKITLIECFDNWGNIIEQSELYYDPKYPLLPSVIVARSMVGDSLLRDSIVVKYKKFQEKLEPQMFFVPSGLKYINK
jgi:hypothetical protein